MKSYQVFVNLSGYIIVKADSRFEAESIVEDGYPVVEAVKHGLLDIEIEDICEFKEVNMCKKEYPSELKSKKVHNKDCFWCGSEMIRSSYGWKVCANCGWKHRAEGTKFEK